MHFVFWGKSKGLFLYLFLVLLKLQTEKSQKHCVAFSPKPNLFLCWGDSTSDNICIYEKCILFLKCKLTKIRITCVKGTSAHIAEWHDSVPNSSPVHKQNLLKMYKQKISMYYFVFSVKMKFFPGFPFQSFFYCVSKEFEWKHAFYGDAIVPYLFNSNVLRLFTLCLRRTEALQKNMSLWEFFWDKQTRNFGRNKQ